MEGVDIVVLDREKGVSPKGANKGMYHQEIDIVIGL